MSASNCSTWSAASRSESVDDVMALAARFQ
jgi:hypothetical protein